MQIDVLLCHRLSFVQRFIVKIADLNAVFAKLLKLNIIWRIKKKKERGNRDEKKIDKIDKIFCFKSY